MADHAPQPGPVALNLEAHDLPEDALALAALDADTDSGSDTDSETNSDNGDRTFQLVEMMMNFLKTHVDFTEDDAQFEGMDPSEARVRAMEIAAALSSDATNAPNVDISGAPAGLVFECLMHLFEHEKREMKRVQEETERIQEMSKKLKKARKCLKEQVARHQAQPEQQQADEQ